MSQEPVGINVAPLIGLWGCPFQDKSHPVFEGLELVAHPRIQIDQSNQDQLGEKAYEELKAAQYALQHTYDALPDIHLGEPEKKSDEILKRALIALWITQPTGADIRYFLRYRHPWHSHNAASIAKYHDWLRMRNLR